MSIPEAYIVEARTFKIHKNAWSDLGISVAVVAKRSIQATQ
jgi:hypothetical protein